MRKSHSIGWYFVVNCATADLCQFWQNAETRSTPFWFDTYHISSQHGVIWMNIVWHSLLDDNISGFWFVLRIFGMSSRKFVSCPRLKQVLAGVEDDLQLHQTGPWPKYFYLKKKLPALNHHQSFDAQKYFWTTYKMTVVGSHFTVIVFFCSIFGIRRNKSGEQIFQNVL